MSTTVMTIIRYLLCVMWLALLVACSSSGSGSESGSGSFFSFFEDPNTVESLQIDRQDFANRNNPIVVEWVFVYNTQLIEKLEEQDAVAWFANKNTYRLNYPNGSDVDEPQGFDIVLWELVEGGKVPEKKMPEAHDEAPAVYIFVHYYNSNKHFRARVDDYENIVLSLRQNDVLVYEKE